MNYLTEKTYHSTISYIRKVVSSMANSIRLTIEEYKLAIDYAKRHSLTLGEAFKQALFERIEDEYDLKVAEEALEEYSKNPVSYSHEEVCKMLEID